LSPETAIDGLGKQNPVPFKTLNFSHQAAANLTFQTSVSIAVTVF
jgi:hypothetical protein